MKMRPLSILKECPKYPQIEDTLSMTSFVHQPTRHTVCLILVYYVVHHLSQFVGQQFWQDFIVCTEKRHRMAFFELFFFGKRVITALLQLSSSNISLKLSLKTVLIFIHLPPELFLKLHWNPINARGLPPLHALWEVLAMPVVPAGQHGGFYHTMQFHNFNL